MEIAEQSSASEGSVAESGDQVKGQGLDMGLNGLGEVCPTILRISGSARVPAGIRPICLHRPN